VMSVCLSCSAVFLRFLSISSRCRLGVWSLSRAFMGSFSSMLRSIVLFWILIWSASVPPVLRVISPWFRVFMSCVSACCWFCVGVSLFL
jgi:hypothetical protein